MGGVRLTYVAAISACIGISSCEPSCGGCGAHDAHNACGATPSVLCSMPLAARRWQGDPRPSTRHVGCITRGRLAHAGHLVWCVWRTWAGEARTPDAGRRTDGRPDAGRPDAGRRTPDAGTFKLCNLPSLHGAKAALRAAERALCALPARYARGRYAAPRRGGA